MSARFWPELARKLRRLFLRMPHRDAGVGDAALTQLTLAHPILSGRRAVHLSDLHIDRHEARHDRVLDQVGRVAPTWIFVTGDLLDLQEGVPHVFRFLGRLRELAPVYLTLGNHDHQSGIPVPAFREMCAAHDLTLLVNEHVTVDCGRGRIAIVGLDDPSLHRADPAAITAAGEHDGVLLLAHAPGVLDLLEPEHAVDLVLCGHSHGGQLKLPGLPVLWLPSGCNRRAAGWHHRGNHALHVNRGLGWSLLPLRLNCPPEIVVIDWVDPEPE